ncbi:MAG: GAF domain-containing protein [Roseateles sp.]
MFDKARVLTLSKRPMDGLVLADEFYNELTLLLAEQMGCSRASLWIYPDPVARDSIQCLRLYDRDQDSWSQGTELREADFGPYFAAMRRDNLIVASDARTHPVTDCFTAVYFEPLGIYSLLDVGINIGGQPWGLFCCENTNDVLDWTPEHVDYLRQVGTLLGFALKKAQG